METVLNRRLSDPAFRLLMVLRLLAADNDSVQVSGAQLSTVMGKTEGAVWRSMRELRKLGYIERDRVHNPGYLCGAQANVYTLHIEGWDHA